MMSFFCVESSAQRTMRGQMFISAAMGTAVEPGGRTSGRTLFGQYQAETYWASGLAVSGARRGLSSGGSMEYIRLSGYGEWMFRIAGTRNRAFSLYAGPGVFLGYEAYDPWDRLPSYIDTGLGRGAFIYGMHTRLETEVFVSAGISVTLGIEPSAVFGSALDCFLCKAEIGIRIML